MAPGRPNARAGVRDPLLGVEMSSVVPAEANAAKPEGRPRTRRAWDDDLTIDLVLTDERSRHRLTLRHGALTHRELSKEPAQAAGLTLHLTRPRLLGVLAGKGLAGVRTEGDPRLLERLLSRVTAPNPAFPVVTP